jgi:exosortase F-associated protein
MRKYLLIAGSLITLVAIYIFQRFNFAAALNYLLPEAIEFTSQQAFFVVNKVSRLILNDAACMVLIYALFNSKDYLRPAFYLFLIELFIILPLYLMIKLNFEGDSELSSPLLSQIHRLVVNPLLMFLLMLGFVYQKLKKEKV